MNITLREALDSDREFLFQLFKAAMRPHIEQMFGPWDEDAQRARFDDLTNPAAHEIVQIDGQNVGCLSVLRSSTEIYIGRIFLLPDVQRRGVGTHLIRDLLAQAASMGVPVRLRVLRVNPAQRLYARLGFRVTGETETHAYMEHEVRTR